MAIGTPTTLGSSPSIASVTHTHATTATAPSGALIIVVAGWGSGTDRTATVTGGGLTWTTDQSNVSAGGYKLRIGVFSAPAPAGLASGTTLTLTTSGADDGANIAACYVTGVDVGGTRKDASTGSAAVTASWDTTAATTTNADDLIIGGSFGDGNRTSTATVGTELFDFQNATNAWSMTVTYQIVASTGSKSLTGTWSASVDQVAGFVAYKSAVAAGDATVTAVVADSAGSAPVAAISSGATVTAVVADSAGSAPPANQIVSIVLNVPAVISAGSAPAAAVSTGGSDATVTAVVADSAGSAPVAALQTGSTVTAVVSDSAGTAPAATIVQGTAVTAVPALSRGEAPRGTVSPAPAGGGVSGDVAATFAEASS